MPDRVIFLDIDGPMIPYTSFLFNAHASLEQRLDDRCIRVLRLILDRSGAKIVFNTTHNRMLHPEAGERGAPGLLHQFAMAGFADDIHPANCTIYPDVDRLTAIRSWLAPRPSDTVWAALDDVSIADPRACLVDADHGIGIREYNHCATVFGYKPFLAL